MRSVVEQSTSGRFCANWHYDDMFDLQDSSRKLLQWGPWLSNLLQVDFVLN